MNLLLNLLLNNAEPNKKREKLATTSKEAITVSLLITKPLQTQPKYNCT